ncbi:MAG: GIY-YIG nuclease family protein [Parcubacteria group bacterium]
MIYLYVIKSKKISYRYIGITNNLTRRLGQHNNGYNKNTRTYKPFDLILSEKYADYKEARKREIFLKSGVGRKFLDDLKI